MSNKRLSTGRESKLPFLRDCAAEIPSSEIGARGSRFGRFSAHQLSVIEIACFSADFPQARLSALRGTGLPRFLDIDMSTIRQCAYGIGKREVVSFHYEPEHIATFAAAKAMPKLRDGVNLARRRLLVVEWAAAPEVSTPLLEGHALSDDGDNVARFADLLDIFVADCHAVIIANEKRR